MGRAILLKRKVHRELDLRRNAYSDKRYVVALGNSQIGRPDYGSISTLYDHHLAETHHYTSCV
jgi:poly-D-alanine transfer protein DltD